MSTKKLPYPRFSIIVRDFIPSWFTLIMGTGMLALVCLTLSKQWAWLNMPAQILHVFNLLLFIALLIPWVWRWIKYPKIAWATMNHPIQANLYPTFSIALLVLATEGLAFGENIEFIKLLWWTGAILTYVFSFMVLYHIFMNDNVTLDHVMPSQFIPAVGLVVIPIAGAPLLGHMLGTARELALLLNILGFGAGCLMYIGLFALMIFRSYLHKPLLGMMTPSVWIHMSPLGIIPVSLMNLLPQISMYRVMDSIKVLALLFFGAGVWWVIMSILITLTAYQKRQLPFSLSWWGFIFPLGALAMLSLRIAHETELHMAFMVGVLLAILMALMWVLSLYKTVIAVIKGHVFIPHKV